MEIFKTIFNPTNMLIKSKLAKMLTQFKLTFVVSRCWQAFIKHTVDVTAHINFVE